MIKHSGPGSQTIAPARATQGAIIAIDTHQPFLDELARRAAGAGMADRIHSRNASMFDLEYDEPFDLLWSEGAIYIIGFERGLREWRRLLKPGGFVAVTEISWLKPNPPEAAYRFWNEAYPAMETVEENLAGLSAAHLNGHSKLGGTT